MRPVYFAERAIRNLRGSPLPAMAISISVAVGVFLFGALVVTGVNLDRSLRGWAGTGDHLTVYLQKGVDSDVVESLAAELRSRPDVEAIEVVPPETGLSVLEQSLGVDAGILEGIDATAVLPAVLLVRLGADAVDPEILREMADELASHPAVESAEADALWLERYQRLVVIGRGLALGWALLLGAGILVVVGNSARLAAFTRKDEIEVLRLVGASDLFILVPFFVEGLLVGLLGWALGLGALAVAWRLLLAVLGGEMSFTADLHFLDPTVTIALFVAAPLLSAFGATFSAWRFLQKVEM